MTTSSSGSADLDDAQRARVAMTTSCRDTDGLPKVAGAGTVRLEGGTRVQVMHNGLLIEEGCYYGPWMTEIIRELRGHHEPQEEVVVAQVLERLADETGPVMVELGSFWAFYSMWFLRRHPSGRAVAMEPDPAYLEVGRRNLALNGLEATLVHGAVGREPGGTAAFVAESDGREVRVPQHSLASLLQATGTERVSVLMCDIQGFELVLLEGARELLEAGRVRFLVVSTHHWSISGDPLTHQKVLDLLAGLGAHVVAEHSVSESFSGDGLVVASFDPRDRDLVVPLSHARSRQTLFGESELQLNHVWHERDAARAQVAAVRAELVEAQAELYRLQAGSAAPPQGSSVRRVVRRLRRALPPRR